MAKDLDYMWLSTKKWDYFFLAGNGDEESSIEIFSLTLLLRIHVELTNFWIITKCLIQCVMKMELNQIRRQISGQCNEKLKQVHTGLWRSSFTLSTGFLVIQGISWLM